MMTSIHGVTVSFARYPCYTVMVEDYSMVLVLLRTTYNQQHAQKDYYERFCTTNRRMGPLHQIRLLAEEQ